MESPRQPGAAHAGRALTSRQGGARPRTIQSVRGSLASLASPPSSVHLQRGHDQHKYHEEQLEPEEDALPRITGFMSSAFPTTSHPRRRGGVPSRSRGSKRPDPHGLRATGQTGSLAGLMRDYSRETESYKSLLLEREHATQAALSAEEGPALRPSGLRSAFAMDTLESIRSDFGRYEGLLGQLVKELMRSVYRIDVSATQGEILMPTPSFASDLSAPPQLDSGNMPFYLELTPYFELCERLERKLADATTKLAQSEQVKHAEFATLKETMRAQEQAVKKLATENKRLRGQLLDAVDIQPADICRRSFDRIVDPEEQTDVASRILSRLPGNACEKLCKDNIKYALVYPMDMSGPGRANGEAIEELRICKEALEMVSEERKELLDARDADGFELKAIQLEISTLERELANAKETIELARQNGGIKEEIDCREFGCQTEIDTELMEELEDLIERSQDQTRVSKQKPDSTSQDDALGWEDELIALTSANVRSLTPRPQYESYGMDMRDFYSMTSHDVVKRLVFRVNDLAEEEGQSGASNFEKYIPRPVKEKKSQGGGSFFNGLGESRDVPKYLRWPKKQTVARKPMQKKEIDEFILSVWEARRGRMHAGWLDFMSDFMESKLGARVDVIKYTYNLVDNLKKYAYDTECEVFMRIFLGGVSEDVYWEAQHMLQWFSDTMFEVWSRAVGLSKQFMVEPLLDKITEVCEYKRSDHLKTITDVFKKEYCDKKKSSVQMDNLFILTEDASAATTRILKPSKFTNTLKYQHWDERDIYLNFLVKGLTTFDKDANESMGELTATQYNTVFEWMGSPDRQEILTCGYNRPIESIHETGETEAFSIKTFVARMAKAPVKLSVKQAMVKRRNIGMNQITEMAKTSEDSADLSEATINAIRKAVAESDVFGDLDQGLIDEMVLSFEPTTVEAGATVIRQGDVGDIFYIVESGTCAVHHKSSDDPSPASLGPEVGQKTDGASFGDIALLYDEPRTASVVAQTSCVLLGMTRSSFRMWVQKNRDRRQTYYKECLRMNAIFKLLDDADLTFLVNNCNQVEFENGDAIIKQGDVGDVFYVLVEGTATVIQEKVLGAPQTAVQLAELPKGCVFGEMALFLDQPRGASIYATSSPCVALVLDKVGFMRVIGNEQSNDLLSAHIEKLNKKNDATKQIMEDARDDTEDSPATLSPGQQAMFARVSKSNDDGA